MPELIRPLKLEDYGVVEALIRAEAPERSDSVSRWPTHAGTESSPKDDSRFHVAQDDVCGAIIGYGAVWPQQNDRSRLDVVVTEAWRRRGIGSALLEQLLIDAIEQGASVVQARALDSRPDALKFLTRHGFSETNRMAHLRLNVPSAELSPLQSRLQQVMDSGVVISTLGEEQVRTVDCAARLQELVRHTEPLRADPYHVHGDMQVGDPETARFRFEEYKALTPDAFFIAKHGDDYIGLSYLGESSEPGCVHQGDTAVHVDWRSRGVAILLKARTIEHARESGAHTIFTTTASTAMRSLNEKLGFTVDWADVRLIRELHT